MVSSCVWLPRSLKDELRTRPDTAGLSIQMKRYVRCMIYVILINHHYTRRPNAETLLIFCTYSEKKNFKKYLQDNYFYSAKNSTALSMFGVICLRNTFASCKMHRELFLLKCGLLAIIYLLCYRKAMSRGTPVVVISQKFLFYLAT